MATPPDVIKAVSAATGLSMETVQEVDRWLVKGKLRPVGGRGPNVARLSPLDAARLLTALLAGPQLNTSVEAVLRYEQTRPDKARSSKGLYEGVGLAEMTALPARHGFVEGLAALITCAAKGKLAQMKLSSKEDPHPHLEVFALTRVTRGRIRISGLPGGTVANVEYIPAATENAKGRKAVSGEAAGDLEQSRRISEYTIFSVAELFR